MFHTPLQLPHDIVVADNEVLLSELSCLYGLLYVISGLLAGGSPGFRIVLCCFTHFPSVAMFVMAFLCFGVCVCLLPYPDRVDTMLSPLRSLLDVAELASQSHSLLVLLVFCFGGLFVFVLFCVFFLFVCCLFVVALLVTVVGTMYRSMPVQLLRLFSIAYVNALISQFILLATCN